MLMTFSSAVALLSLAAAATPISLERPWNLQNWKADGDYVAGGDVFRLGTKHASASSLWTETLVPWDEWTFEVSMRTFAGDADPGNSGLAFFHTEKPLGVGPLHGSDSNYDGLAITVDSMGWDEHGKDDTEDKGAVRGHLNDGTKSFTSTPAADAFSLCRMPYRKTSEPIKVRIGYGRGVFAVEVNDQRCFTSDKITLPQGYFGISAATGLSDDTFALDSVRITEGLDEKLVAYFDASQVEPHAAGGEDGFQGSTGSGVSVDPSHESEQRFSVQPVDLNPVLDAIRALGARVDSIQGHVEGSQQNIKDALSIANDKSPGLENTVDLLDKINRIVSRVEGLESKLDSLASRQDTQHRSVQSVEGKIDRVASSIDSHSKTLPETVGSMISSTPSLWGPAVLLLLGQGAIYVGYQAYTARANKHQKLL